MPVRAVLLVLVNLRAACDGVEPLVAHRAFDHRDIRPFGGALLWRSRRANRQREELLLLRSLPILILGDIYFLDHFLLADSRNATFLAAVCICGLRRETSPFWQLLLRLLGLGRGRSLAFLGR